MEGLRYAWGEAELRRSLLLLANGAGKSDLVFGCLIAVTVLSAVVYWVIQYLGNRVWWRAF